MVADTETQVRALLDYCGLAFDQRCLRFFENDRPVRTASSEQVRQPIYRDGVDQWRISSLAEPWSARWPGVAATRPAAGRFHKRKTVIRKPTWGTRHASQPGQDPQDRSN
jgi:hypothetical protein